ncbi:flagellin [Pseudoduganella ginsengisoli]|uniref:Flagellin n=1 Tax=Pseudoduganella ginsengisoli TaxID=1462440 RepID=A0A6L6PUQ9_9BURK|nr:flagellin [Pseudoduganella ginsengisoli]MTW01250.1 flagellin [Pseudoduganella ginsengisoli]
MQINSNIDAMNAGRSLLRSGSDVGVSLARLSSGSRINSAKDDAAGLSISERLTAGVNGMNRAAKNVNDGISLVQVADGAASQLAENFQRIRELAVQAANGTYTSDDRKSIQGEVNSLMKANYDIVRGAKFNNLNLLDGSFREDFQVGDKVGQTVSLAIPAVLPINQTQVSLVDTPVMQVKAIGQVQGALAAGSLVLNGAVIGASTAGVNPGQNSFSAWSVARAINNANPPDVTALAENKVTGTAGAGGGAAAGDLTINGVSIGAFAGATPAALAAAAAGAISGASGGSGVVASASGATITLEATDGRDIAIGGPAAAALGLAATMYHGTVTLTNTASVDADNLTIAGSNPGAAGFAGGIVKPQATGATQMVLRAVGSGDPPIDLSTAASATSMLDFIDGKLDKINAMRASLGATENRLTHAHDNLVNSVENASAARSRILDTDYAAETMQLTRNQILQQAGMAMVAQANSLPNQALLLLRA